MFLQNLIVVISPLIFAVIAWYFLKSKKQLQEEEKLEISRIRLHDQKIAEEELWIKNELEENRLHGEMIVKLSEKIAQDLIIELKTALGAKGESLESVVPTGENFETNLTEVSAKIKSSYLSKIVEIMAGLKSFEYQKAHNIVSFQNDEIDKTEQSLKEIRAEELKSLRERMDRYKSDEIKLFEQKVKAVLDAAVKDVLGEALTTSEQEELIIKALEKAKENNAL